MNCKLVVIGLATSAFALFVAPLAARALPVTVTYAGTIVAGEDSESLFGGEVNAGDLITAVFSYDTSLGTRVTSATSDTLEGGLDFGSSPPIVKAAFTIDGFTYTFTPDYDAVVSTGTGIFNFNTGTNTLSGSNITATSLAGDVSQVLFATTNPPSRNLTMPYTGAGTGIGYLDTAYDLNNNSDEFTFAVAAAPEPEAWLLMGMGVMGLGVALRRRRKSVQLPTLG